MMMSSGSDQRDPAACRPGARAWLVAVFVLFATLRSAGEPVVPDSATARVFAAELVRDYATHRADALMSRVDYDAAYHLIFGNPSDPAFRPGTAWEKSYEPIVKQALKPLDEYSMLAVTRVWLRDDARWLECGFLSEKSTVIQVMLRLVASGTGTTRISDILVSGSPLSVGQVVRQLTLIQGEDVPGLREDEVMLQFYGRNNGELVRGAFDLLSRGQYDAAFGTWNQLPDGMKQTAIWRHFRNIMAMLGAKAAGENLLNELNSGTVVDPFVALRVANQRNDRTAALEYLNRILDTCAQPLLYRCSKAALLLESDRPLEAYQLARDITEIAPATGIAYFTAVRSAAAAKRPELALSMLQNWTRITRPAVIETALAADPGLAAFRHSDAYQNWLKTAAPMAPASGKPSESTTGTSTSTAPRA